MTEQIKNERLRVLLRKAQAAGQKFDEGKKRLYQADGSPLFAEDVMKSEMEELARERNTVLHEVEREAREIAANAGDVLERLRNSDPADLLSEEELERANARRAFALDVAESLSLADLKKRLESVLESADRAAIFAHWMAGQRRRGQIMERQREQAASRAGTPAAAASVGGAPLDELLDRMEEVLGGETRKAELGAAGALGREAFEVEATSNRLRYEGRSFAEIHFMQRAAVPGADPDGAREHAREIERLARTR